MVAACFDTGNVLGIQAGADTISPVYPFGSGPQTLATLRGILLAGDGVDRRLGQMRLQDFGVLTNLANLGSSPNHIVVEDPYVYVVNSLSNTLQVLQRTGDLGPADAGFPFSTLLPVLNLGQNSSPQAIAKIGNNLYIPLYSGLVAEVDVSNPANPVPRRTFDLNLIDLRADAGVRSFPRPSGIAVFRGTVYVALSNLDSAFQPGGPGIVARLNLATGGADPIYLPPSTCLNTYWLVATADTLYVTCNGRAQYDGFRLVSIDNSGAVAIGADGGLAGVWNGGCDGGGCFGAAPGRFAVIGSRLYVGDTLGRIFVLENVDGGFVERRGYNQATGGLPIAACPTSASGFANVQDVIAIP